MKTIFEHRSIRKYKPAPVPQDVLSRVLEAGTRASNTGNMQVYSIVVTTDNDIRAQLSACHFGQVDRMQAPVVMTFCADIHRFSKWCEQRGAKPGYDNFVWFMNGATDVLLASQNISLEAEKHGLGICYLGTTVYTADRICEILELPYGVVPVTSIVLGYPDENPPLTDRLPVEAVIHADKYRDYSSGDIDRFWRGREASEETVRLLAENNLPNLARIFTDRRYKIDDNIAFSGKYLETLKKQGFL